MKSLTVGVPVISIGKTSLHSVIATCHYARTLKQYNFSSYAEGKCKIQVPRGSKQAISQKYDYR
jgi:hypothetical protein